MYTRVILGARKVSCLEVSSIQGCPYRKVSLLERCPQFRAILIEGSTIITGDLFSPSQVEAAVFRCPVLPLLPLHICSNWCPGGGWAGPSLRVHQQ